MSSYLGRGLEQVDNISKLDNITFNGGTTYALTKDSSAFQPISSNAILISISGVIQQGNFTVSGTNIVFNTAVASSESCDFIMHYGTGVAFTPADNSITKDKTNFISNSSSSGVVSKGDGGSVDGSISLNCSQNSHHTKISSASHSSYAGNLNFVLPSSHGTNGQFMKTDGSGNLSFAEAGGGLVPVAQSSGSSGVDNVIVNNWISDTYENYEMYYAINMASTSADLKMTLYDSSGNLSSGNNYEFGHGGVQSSNGSRQTLYGYDQNSFQISHNTNNDAGRISVTGKMTWLHPRTSGKRTTILNHFRMLDTGVTNRAFFGTLEYKGTEALTGFYMNASSGQINYYSIKCYGVKNS
jgi:hypothetical protein